MNRPQWWISQRVRNIDNFLVDFSEKINDKESGLGAMGATIGVCVAVVIILVFFIWLLVRWR